MLESTMSIVQALQNAKQVLFVMHEYLPLPLSLWVPSLVSILKQQNKEITVLVSQDVFGWPKRVDEVYPTDMVLALEQLRQVISIPITNKSETIGDVSYNVTGGNLEITVVPIKETLDMTHISNVTHGKTYDTVIGVGISASHPILSILQNNQASLSRAKSFFVGTYAMQGALAEKLSFIPTVTVLDSQEDKFLREVLQQMTVEKQLEPSQRELVTLFIQSIVASTNQFEYLDKEGYEYLGKLADVKMDSGRMASLYTGDFAKQNRILQQILQSAQKSTNGELLLFTVQAQQVEQVNANIQDIVTALYYLPKYPQVKQMIIIIEENAKRFHVYMNGGVGEVKQVAIKFGFPRTERLTGGIVEGILLEKLCRDLTRIAINEEIIPSFVETYTNTNISSEVELPKKQQMARSVVHENIPTSPSLDEILANTVMTDDVAEGGEEYDAMSAPIVYEPEVQTPVAQVEPEFVQPVVQAPTNTPQATTGLDFAAIAKKMRESIT